MIDEVKTLEDLQKVLELVNKDKKLAVILFGTDFSHSFIGTAGDIDTCFNMVVSLFQGNRNLMSLFKEAIRYIENSELQSLINMTKGQLPS